jgi:hypothetical protein
MGIGIVAGMKMSCCSWLWYWYWFREKGDLESPLAGEGVGEEVEREEDGGVGREVEVEVVVEEAGGLDFLLLLRLLVVILRARRLAAWFSSRRTRSNSSLYPGHSRRALVH